MATVEQREPHDGTSVQELARNGRRRYEWRLVDGARTLVVVGLRFTVPAHDGETDEQFEARMLALCATLAALGFPGRRSGSKGGSMPTSGRGRSSSAARRPTASNG